MVLHDIIATLDALKHAARRSRTEATGATSATSAPDAPSAALARLEALERIQDALAPYFDELIAEMPGLRRRRRIFDGRWLVGVAGDLRRVPRRRGVACTRLEASIEILDARGRARVTIDATVADVELPGFAVVVAAGADGERELDAAIEAACLAFARRYFEDAARAR